jgi:hypothetical protein
MPDGRFMHGGVDQMRTHFQKSDKAKLLWSRLFCCDIGLRVFQVKIGV